MDKQKLLVTSIVGLSFYLIATGISYAAFTFIKPDTFSAKTPVPTPVETNTKPSKSFVVDPSVPKTEACPINGVMYTKQEKEAWDKLRPIAVMIENSVDARPQSGISYADVVYEMVAEGGITRFMGIFYCDSAMRSIAFAPVRSARMSFLPYVMEYDALYNHVGGAGRCEDPTVNDDAKALCAIGQWGIKDMDQFGISFPTCFRNYDRLGREVATEHTMVCLSDKLYQLAAKRVWTNVDSKGVSWDKNFQPWKFKDDQKESSPAASTISFQFWNSFADDFKVTWKYNSQTNDYARFTGGKEHLDLETNLQLTAKNVVILFAKEHGPLDEHLHIVYDNIGTGNGYLFSDGKAIKITWRKPTKVARLKFYDASGKELSLNRGVMWIHVLPIGNEVTYQ